MIAVVALIVSLADAAAFAVGAVGGGGACPQPAWDPAPAYALGATPEQMALTRHIIGCALCEGAALFAVVAILLTRSPYAIAIAAIWMSSAPA